MKILVINTDYPEFVARFYETKPELRTASFATQMSERMATLFGVADFYSQALRSVGHDATDLLINNEIMQLAWLSERGVDFPLEQWKFRLRRGWLPWVSRAKRQDWMLNALAEQVRYFQPNLIFSHEMCLIPPSFWREHKPRHTFLAGQISWIHQLDQSGSLQLAVPDTEQWGIYDLVVSSFPTTVDHCTRNGIASMLCRLAFEPTVRNHFPEVNRDIAVSFVGAIGTGIHKSRLSWLNHVCSQSEVDVWSPSESSIPADSPIRRHLHGNAWGREMYGILNRSRITLNHHGDVPPHANNLRLYEATGMGSLLITDWKSDLDQILAPGTECVAYRSEEECVEQIRYYTSRPKEAAVIAAAGQQRTLRDHSYGVRIQSVLAAVRDRSGLA